VSVAARDQQGSLEQAIRLALLATMLALFSAACAPSAAMRSPAPRQELTVFAAASLRGVFVDLAAAWSVAHPGIELRLAFDGSNVLATQIEEGAPADVFISADVDQPRRLAADGLAAAPPVTLLRNAIAIVTPRSGSPVQTLADLARQGIRIVGTGRGVPITGYAEQAIAQIGGLMSDPAAFIASVAANVVSEEDNVRLALAKVELGEGDAAIVYRTDALSSERVQSLPIPPEVVVSADYAAVQLSTREAAARFVGWLAGPEASDVFRAAGFEPVSR